MPADAPYSIVLAPGARRALAETLPADVAFAAWELISGPLRQRPHIVGAPLRAPFEGLWRARRGEYRVRYRIDEAKHEVIVLDIDHRRWAYRSADSPAPARLPARLVHQLKAALGLNDADIAVLSKDQAVARMTAFWSQPPPDGPSACRDQRRGQ